MPKPTINRTRSAVLDEALSGGSPSLSDGGSAEERLTRAVDHFSDRVTRAIHALERQSDDPAPQPASGHPLNEIELRRGLRDVVDQLQESECERDALWEETTRLKHEIVCLKQALAHTHQIHEHARAVEATRGWRMLLVLRRIRMAIFRR